MDIFEKIKLTEKNVVPVPGAEFIEVKKGLFMLNSPKPCNLSKMSFLEFEYYLEPPRVVETKKAKRNAEKIYKIFSKSFYNDFTEKETVDKLLRKILDILEKDVNFAYLDIAKQKEIIEVLCTISNKGVADKKLLVMTTRKLHDCGLSRDIWFSDYRYSSTLGFKFLSAQELQQRDRYVAEFINEEMTTTALEKLLNTRKSFSLKTSYPFYSKTAVLLFEYGRIPLSIERAKIMCQNLEHFGEKPPECLLRLAGYKVQKSEQPVEKKIQQEIDAQVEEVFSKAQTQEQ